MHGKNFQLLMKFWLIKWSKAWEGWKGNEPGSGKLLWNVSSAFLILISLPAMAFLIFVVSLRRRVKTIIWLSTDSLLEWWWAVGSPACATVLCLFLILWPEATVYIFRTTAGYLQAGDHSSGFITAQKMTQVSLWSQLCLWRAEKPLHLIATKNPAQT